jgi:hypothetical protein
MVPTRTSTVGQIATARAVAPEERAKIKDTSRRDSRKNVRVRCKDRPTQTKKTGGGGRKEFIPWCK